MSDFMTALEAELRAAARRRPRPAWRVLPVGPLVAAAAAVVAGVVVAAALLAGGDDRSRVGAKPRLLPVGAEIPRGGGHPPRDSDSIVVATGRIPVRWQMELSRSRKLVDRSELLQPAGLPCLGLFLPDAPPSTSVLGKGCGRFPRTPGFSRHQRTVRDRDGRPRWLLVYGWTPERAAGVRLVTRRATRVEAMTYEGPTSVRGDFYFFAIPRYLPGARVYWVARDGRERSRGIELLPP